MAISLVFFSHGVTAAKPLGAGVDLFFVLSGFLIGRIYFRSTAAADFSLWRFWRARWWRTLPPYYAAVALFAAFSLKFSGNPIHWYYILFAQNYVGMSGFEPSWSLCVEEHFYLLLPLLGWLAERTLGRRSFLWLLPIAAFIPQLLRLWYLIVLGRFPSDWYWMTHLHCEGLILGVFLAFLYVDHEAIWRKLRPIALLLTPIPLVLLLVMMIHPAASMASQVWICLAWALGFSGWLRTLYDLKWEPASRAGDMVKNSIHGLALCSYSVYLVHVLFFTDIRTLIDAWPRGPVKSGFILASTFLLSLVFYFLVERPTIRMRDRYLGRTADKSTEPETVTASEAMAYGASPSLD